MTVNFMINQLYDIIKDLPSNLGVYQESDDFDLEWELSHDAKEVIGNCHVNHGASKCVIISDFCNKVIKIPFNGMWVSAYNEDDDWVDDDFIEFEAAAGDTNGWDYCAVEEELYEEIREEGQGLEKYFAETKYITTIGNTPIYVQDKVTSVWDADTSNKFSEHSRSRAYELCGRLNATWVAMFIEIYGEAEFHKFYEYIKATDIIRDLHSDNIGYRLTGEPVVLDYSGYREDI